MFVVFPQYYCLSALFSVIQTRTTPWYQRLLIHTRLTGKSECKTRSRCTTPFFLLIVVLWVNLKPCPTFCMCLPGTTNWQEIGHISMQCENAREINIQMRTKETRLICNLRQMSNRGKQQQQQKTTTTRQRPIFLEEEEVQWGTVPPGFPCAELLPCAVLHDLYGSVEQDLMGSLKHSHMEHPENSSQSILSHSDFKLLILLLWLSLSSMRFICIISLSMIHIIVLLRSDMFNIILGDLALPFRGTVCVPLDVLLLLYFHVFSGLSVLLFFRYMCNWGRMFPVQHANGAVPLPAADLLAHTTPPPPKQCERSKESLGSKHPPQSKLRLHSVVLMTQVSCCQEPAGPSPASPPWGRTGWMSTSIFLTHAVNAVISCISTHPWLVSIVHKILLSSTCYSSIVRLSTVAAVWPIAKLRATSSVQLLRYLTNHQPLQAVTHGEKNDKGSSHIIRPLENGKVYWFVHVLKMLFL